MLVKSRCKCVSKITALGRFILTAVPRCEICDILVMQFYVLGGVWTKESWMPLGSFQRIQVTAAVSRFVCRKQFDSQLVAGCSSMIEND